LFTAMTGIFTPAYPVSKRTGSDGDGGNRGPRPPGRIRPHQVELARALKARWAAALYRVAIDPDGRPLPLRRDTSL
jgi:hypothetical protein